MTKEDFIKLREELGRDPTDDEMADFAAKQIEAGERRVERFINPPDA